MKKASFFQALLCLFIMTACNSEQPVDSVDKPLPEDEVINDDISSDWELSSRIELTPNETATADGINQFSYSLMKNAAALSRDGEFCMSPVSASIYLGMIANATDGAARNQILEALGINDIDALNSLCEKMMHYLPCEDNGSSISINNCFWVSDSYSVPEEFVSIIGKTFNAGVKSVDFTESSTVPAINQWVSDKTNGLIPTLLEGDWQNYVYTVMTNANTVYFKGNWESKFKKEDTKQEIFHSPTADVEVSMMHQTLRTAYAGNEKVQIITMSFEGPVNTMELYLPAEGESVMELIEWLTPKMQHKLKSTYELCDVTLSLPSFQTQHTTDLATILDKIGISLLGDADFSPMGLGSLPLSTIHKTSVKIDEDGAEMAAMTGGWLGAGPETKEPRQISIDFNRPFLYLVRNYHTGAILMAGAVTNP